MDSLRKQYIIMAKNTNTPITFWQSMTLQRFRRWIKANNQAIAEQEKQLKK